MRSPVFSCGQLDVLPRRCKLPQAGFRTLLTEGGSEIEVALLQRLALGGCSRNGSQAYSAKFASIEFPEVLIIRYPAFNCLAHSQEEIR